MNKLLLIILISLLVGCTYHYHLNIVIGESADPNKIQIEESVGVEPPPKDQSPLKPGLLSPQAQAGPMSIEPGQFSASQTKGGNMINIILNLNSAKPTEVTTDTALSGIPGL